MIAFATGGLLGDVCMHLIPHSFMGESETSAGTVIDGVRYVLVEEKRNIIIGVSSIPLRQLYGKSFTEDVAVNVLGRYLWRILCILLSGQDDESTQLLT
jgi:hypothetical protein